MANAFKTWLSDMANSIRNKTGKTEKLSPINYPMLIDSIGGGGGEEDSGWVTVLEETDITPTYNDSYGCYSTTLSNNNWVDNYLNCGCSIFIVHYNGIKYPIGMQANAVKITSGGLSGQYLARVHTGNLAIQKLFYGQSFEQVSSSYHANEPFCIIGAQPLEILFADGATRKIKIEYMPRTVDA